MGGSESRKEEFSYFFEEGNQKKDQTSIMRNNKIGKDEELQLSWNKNITTCHEIFESTWQKQKHLNFLGTREKLGIIYIKY